MKIPFTLEQFLEVFRNYNLSVWPMQIIFYALALLTIWLLLKNTASANRAILVILSFFWIWMGTMYHLIFFSAINKAAFLFGFIFIFQGILLFIRAFKKQPIFIFQFNLAGIVGAILVIYALLVYPLLSYSFNHTYPYAPTLGLPCPTTIFTIGLLIMAAPPIPVSLAIIPMLWSIIGFSASFLLGFYEDTGLLISGLLLLIITIITRKQKAKGSYMLFPGNRYPVRSHSKKEHN